MQSIKSMHDLKLSKKNNALWKLLEMLRKLLIVLDNFHWTIRERKTWKEIEKGGRPHNQERLLNRERFATLN